MINTRYEIIKKLGQGRSSVYLCRDIEFPEKEYAIKILPPIKDKHEQEIFVKEFSRFRNLNILLSLKPLSWVQFFIRMENKELKLAQLL